MQPRALQQLLTGPDWSGIRVLFGVRGVHTAVQSRVVSLRGSLWDVMDDPAPVKWFAATDRSAGPYGQQ